MTVEKPRRIELEADLRDCGPLPMPPDPDDPATTQKDVGDYMTAFYSHDVKCGGKHGTTIEIIDRNNAEAVSPGSK